MGKQNVSMVGGDSNGGGREIFESKTKQACVFRK